jgi:hypothetical protein
VLGASGYTGAEVILFFHAIFPSLLTAYQLSCMDRFVSPGKFLAIIMKKWQVGLVWRKHRMHGYLDTYLIRDTGIPGYDNFSKTQIWGYVCVYV